MRTFSEFTTLQVGGPIKSFVQVHGPNALAEAVLEADSAGLDMLVLGGGSNLLAADSLFDGVVIQDTSSEQRTQSHAQGMLVSASAGFLWDELVQYTVDEGLSGIEALSGIPGTAGAAPVQNIGAYGQEVGDCLQSVTVWDRALGRIRELSHAQLQLTYRHSVLKASRAWLRPAPATSPSHQRTPEGQDHAPAWGFSGRFIVLEIHLLLSKDGLSAPLRFGPLASALGFTGSDNAEGDTRAPLADVRAAVLELRRSKGMVLDATDRDTYSAGSFFMNPILQVGSPEERALPPEAPRYPVVPTPEAKDPDQLGVHSTTQPLSPVGGQPQGQGPIPATAVDTGSPSAIKTSAAWLIDHAGMPKGWAAPGSNGKATLSTKHVLALTNRGGATAEDIAHLARTVRANVQTRYRITLNPEPVTLGLTL
ncbi:MAG: UDP-N-acetylmuramate dehydrogenase [Actinomycetaceae bacterium]|nr:UDP-N-acetylmuramate dehydrogenase [Actinomycetaceae bacterium]